VSLHVFFDPINEMVLECALDDLVKEVRSDELMNIRSGKVTSKWLMNQI
jgi:hypothetical protein